MNDAQKALRAHVRPEKKVILQKFFKTGPGEYSEGDVFIGVVVPDTRKVAREFVDLSTDDLLTLLKSEVHEDRLLALLILVEQYKKADLKRRNVIISLYLKNTRFVNNWDLVDASADKLLGTHVLDKETDILESLAASKNLWERRIAMVSTFAFIRKNRFDTTLRIARILLNDPHDLIHKATGWMLREVGKRDAKVLEDFLAKNSKSMSRTTLRYAIERLSAAQRSAWLSR